MACRAGPRVAQAGAVTSEMSDMKLRALRRDRAARRGPELFLLNRAFDDCLERVGMIRREFPSALLLGCPSPDWPGKLSKICRHVDVFDPGNRFALGAGGRTVIEPDMAVEPASYDLIIAVGTLDSTNRLDEALLRLRFALRPDGLLLGAMAGGDSIPRLRAAMRAADDMAGIAVPHVHPRISPPALAGLLGAAGFQMPVVDIDRISVSYPSLRRLVADLRGMAATNILSQRSKKPLPKRALAAAERAFAHAGDGDRTTETFEILHFAGWSGREGDASFANQH
jgi:NADH dehydrogenase [ubiquinone] 1 alpha subcomplex assembly factor 5